MVTTEEHYDELIIRNEREVSYNIFNPLTDRWVEKRNVTYYDMIVDYQNALRFYGNVQIKCEYTE